MLDKPTHKVQSTNCGGRSCKTHLHLRPLLLLHLVFSWWWSWHGDNWLVAWFTSALRPNKRLGGGQEATSNPSFSQLIITTIIIRIGEPSSYVRPSPFKRARANRETRWHRFVFIHRSEKKFRVVDFSPESAFCRNPTIHNFFLFVILASYPSTGWPDHHGHGQVTNNFRKSS